MAKEGTTDPNGKIASFTLVKDKSADPSAAMLTGSPAMKLKVPIVADIKETRDIGKLAGELTRSFQTSLLIWFKKPDNKRNLGILLLIINRLYALAHERQIALLWWLAGGVVESLMDDGLKVDEDLKQMLAQLESQIRELAETGESQAATRVPDALLKSLLSRVTLAKSSGETVNAIRQAVDDQGTRSQSDASSIKNSKPATKPKLPLLRAVSSAIRSDISKIRRLIVQISEDQPVNEKRQVVELTLRLASVLDISGMSSSAEVLREQLVLAEKNGKPLDDRLMPLVGALKYIDAKVAGLLNGTVKDDKPNHDSSQSFERRYRKVLGVAVEQAQIEIAKIVNALERYEQYSFDHRLIEETPFLFGRVADGLHAVALDRAAEMVLKLGGYVEQRLIKDKLIPEDGILNALMQAMSGIGYYLQASAAKQPHADQLLEVVEEIIDRLHYTASTEMTMVLDLAEIQAALPKAAKEQQIDRAIENGLAMDSDVESSNDARLSNVFGIGQLTDDDEPSQQDLGPQVGDLSGIDVEPVHNMDFTAIIESCFGDKE